jgi:uncharacterized lipoprotein YbaY
MRPVLLAIAVIGLVAIGAAAAGITDHKAEKDPGGISTVALSRCAGIAGIEIREADAAFGQLMLDGAPLLTAEHNYQSVVIGSTGMMRRRNGTTVPFRFLCVLDETGQGAMFRIAAVEETPPSSRPIRGVAVPGGLKSPLARGAELRVQLFDVSDDPNGELLAEQVVRSGWEVPIPFALRAPAAEALARRQLVIDARIVLARAVTFRMPNRRPLKPGELQLPLTLDLVPSQ